MTETKKKKTFVLLYLHMLMFLRAQWNEHGIDTWEKRIADVKVVLYRLEKKTVKGKDNDLFMN